MVKIETKYFCLDCGEIPEGDVINKGGLPVLSIRCPHCQRPIYGKNIEVEEPVCAGGIH